VKKNDGLMALHEKCKAAARRAGLELEKRKYMPHVTLAYLRHTPPERVIAFETRTSRFYIFLNYLIPVLSADLKSNCGACSKVPGLARDDKKRLTKPSVVKSSDV